jgi:peptide deformylase
MALPEKAPLEVLQFPDPRLKNVSVPVAKIDEDLRKRADQMLQVMYSEPGIGLAAPQVGDAVRLIVMDTSWSDEGSDRSPTVIVNPKIVSRDGEITWEEGCLSVPDFTAEVERAGHVVVEYQNLEGEDVTEDVTGLRAVCFQHEIDHLDGILFIDRISRLKRSMYLKRRKKQLRHEEEPASLGS